MSSRVQSHFLLLTQDSHGMTFLNISSKATEPVVMEFHIEPPEVEETKIYSKSLGHMTNIATTPIYIKIF